VLKIEKVVVEMFSMKGDILNVSYPKKEQLAQNQNNNHRLNDTLPFMWKT